MKCVLELVPSLGLSSIVSGSGRKLRPLLAVAACRLAKVGTRLFLPEFVFFTSIGRAVTFLARMGLLMIPFGVWGGGVDTASSGEPESKGLLVPDLLTVTTAALPRSACTAG